MDGWIFEHNFLFCVPKQCINELKYFNSRSHHMVPTSGRSIMSTGWYIITVISRAPAPLVYMNGIYKLFLYKFHEIHPTI